MAASDPIVLSGHFNAMLTLFNSDFSENSRKSAVGSAAKSRLFQFVDQLLPTAKHYKDLETRQGGHLSPAQTAVSDAAFAPFQARIEGLSADTTSMTRISLGELSEAVVVRHGSQIGVYFRPTSNATEFGSSATNGFVFEPGGGAVAQGYVDTLSQPLPRTFRQEWNDLVQGNAPPPSFQPAIEQQVRREMAEATREGKSPEITVAGLSRGGALAQLTASRWMRGGEFPVHGVYSVSSPMVGNTDWANQFNHLAASKGVSALRMEVGGDIVPKLPPLFFAPAGQLFYFPASSELGRRGVLNPSAALLARDQELICDNNRTQNQSDLMASIKMHFSGKFINVYKDRAEALVEALSGKSGMKESEALALYENLYVKGGSPAEARILDASRHTPLTIGPPSVVPDRTSGLSRQR